MTIIVIGIIGAIIGSVVGTVWYSGSTPMGRWHMQYLGFDKLSEEEKTKMIAEAKPKMWKTYGAQMLLSFITALFIGFVISFTVRNGGPAMAVFSYIFMIWIAFVVPMIGQNILWGTCKGGLAWKIFFSNIFSNLVTFLLTACVAMLFFR